MAQLESYQPLKEEHLERYSENISHAALYRQIFLQARRLNYNISDLEIVLIGLSGDGKSSLLQAILGLPLSFGKTRRTFEYHLVNDPSLLKPRYYIKEISKETEIKFEKLQKELSARNRPRIDSVTLIIEYKWGFDLTVIDTPPIKSLEEMSEWARPAMTGISNRLLVAVEKAKLSKNLQVFQWLKHFDPSLSHSTLVLTSLDNFIDSFQHRPRDLVFQFERMENIPCIWMTLPSHEIAQDCGTNDEKFKLRIFQYFMRDLHSLNMFDLDYSKNQDQIGIYALRKILGRVFEFNFHRHIPSLSRAFEDSISSHNQKLIEFEKNITLWTVDNVRSYAVKYTTHWLRTLDQLIKGSVIGGPSKNGQTLQEEWVQFKLWDLKRDVTSVEWKTSTVDNSQVRLYGAPQLIRLLDEFKNSTKSLDMPDICDVDVLSTRDSAWAASEIARRKIEIQFVPLLETLLNRTFFIMKRLSNICNYVMESSNQKNVNQNLFPSFSTYLKQIYLTTISEALEKCRSKCINEFFSSLTIYWELTEGIDPIGNSGSQDSRNKLVKLVTNEIYEKMKERLIDTFIRFVHTYFLSSSSILALMKSVTANINTLSESTIYEMFLLEQIVEGYKKNMIFEKQKLQELENLKISFKNTLVS